MSDDLPGYISCDIFYYLLFTIYNHVFRKSYGKEITYCKNNYWSNLRSAQILVAG